MNDLINNLNGCEVTGIHAEDSFMNEFGRKLSFRQFYELIKANKQYIYSKNIPYSTCLCKICENAVFFMQGLNKILPKELNLPSNPHDILKNSRVTPISKTVWTRNVTIVNYRRKLLKAER